MKVRASHRIGMRKLTKRELAIGALVWPEATYWRPKTRGDCSSFERPCPFISCRHHLAIDVTREGAIRFDRGEEIWSRSAPSCSLDVADAHRGGMSLEELGAVLGETKQRAHQEVTAAVAAAQRVMRKSEDRATAYELLGAMEAERR